MSTLPGRPPHGEVHAAQRPRRGSDPAPIQVLFVGRDRLCAETLRLALRRVGMEVDIVPPGEAEGAWRPDHPPDLVLIELEVDGAGPEIGERFLRRDPSVKLVGLLSSIDPEDHKAMTGAGFTGYMTKDTPLSTFVHGLRHCLAGRPVRVPSRLEPTRRRRPADLLRDQLTPREREVVAILVEGGGNEQIGLRLHISPNTVRTHIQSILSKLQLHSRVAVVAWAVRHGMAGRGEEVAQPGPSGEGGRRGSVSGTGPVRPRGPGGSPGTS
jgi:DNA-binding NarL/FixJ family response regulator